MIDRRRLETGGFLVFLVAITLALGAVVSSFASALLWSALAAILFQSLYQWLLNRWPGRRNLAASLTLLIILFAVVVPTMIIGSLMVDQAGTVYAKLQSGQINFAAYFQQIHDALPNRLQGLLDKAGLDSFERLQSRVSTILGNSVRTIAGQALSIGRNAAEFVLAFGVGLYVTYFLLRDGDKVGAAICRALPLERSVTETLVDKFVAVVRATIKGSVIVGPGCARRPDVLDCRPAGCFAVGPVDGADVVAACARAGDRLGAGCDLPARDRGDLAGRGRGNLGCRGDRLGGQYPASDPGRARHGYPRLHRAGDDARGDRGGRA
jgi:hypothetical protein